MIALESVFKIIFKGIILVVLLFSFSEIFAAEGGPCKDYGECDKFKYSLNAVSYTHLTLPTKG